MLLLFYASPLFHNANFFPFRCIQLPLYDFTPFKVLAVPTKSITILCIVHTLSFMGVSIPIVCQFLSEGDCFVDNNHCTSSYSMCTKNTYMHGNGLTYNTSVLPSFVHTCWYCSWSRSMAEHFSFNSSFNFFRSLCVFKHKYHDGQELYPVCDVWYGAYKTLCYPKTGNIYHWLSLINANGEPLIASL